MRQLMSDAELRKAMGAKALHNIVRYEPETIMTLWIKLFQSI